MKDKVPLLIAGIGAIGSVLFVRISALKLFKVVCLTSERGCNLIREKGLKVKLVDDIVPKLYHPLIFAFLPDKFKENKITKCIISTKAYYNEVLAKYLVDYLTEDASILLFQNGIHTEDILLRYGPKWKITRASSSIGSKRISNNHVVETATGKTAIGAINHNNNTDLLLWKEILKRSGLDTEITNDIEKQIWLKLIANAAINPLGALSGSPNGKLIRDLLIRKIMTAIVREIVSLEKVKQYINFDEAMNNVITIAQMTAENRCSMLQDIERGRQTEIDYINGAIVKEGLKEGKKMPVNEFVSSLIKKMEKKELNNELALLELRSIEKHVPLK